MTHYFCIAIGMADFTPDTQDYHSADSESEMRELIAAAVDQFEKDCEETTSPGSAGRKACYRYDFRMPREGENNWSQRLRIACYPDRVLDVIGMTADEYAREQDEDYQRSFGED